MTRIDIYPIAVADKVAETIRAALLGMKPIATDDRPGGAEAAIHIAFGLEHPQHWGASETRHPTGLNLAGANLVRACKWLNAPVPKGVDLPGDVWDALAWRVRLMQHRRCV